MSQKRASRESEPELDIAAVVSPAPGITLSEFVALANASGRTAVVGPGGKYAWFKTWRGTLERWPLEHMEPPSPEELRDLLRIRGIWLLRYVLESAKAGGAPNCFAYVCSNPAYSISQFGKKGRRNIRKALRDFKVRLCSWKELAETGLQAYLDTCERHGDAVTLSEIRPPKDPATTSRYCDIWGAWDGDRLVAWLRVFRVDDWAMYASTCSCTYALKGCPSNALFFASCRRYLTQDKVRFVSAGLNTLRVGASEMTMHVFKTRMGFAALPAQRVFVAHPFVAPVLRSRTVSWAADRLAAAMSGSANLRTAAGLARLMSGRETQPLAWYKPEDDEGVSDEGE